MACRLAGQIYATNNKTPIWTTNVYAHISPRSCALLPCIQHRRQLKGRLSRTDIPWTGFGARDQSEPGTELRPLRYTLSEDMA